MIQHLKESIQKSLLNDEGNAAVERIAILQQFKDGGLREIMHQEKTILLVLLF